MYQSDFVLFDKVLQHSFVSHGELPQASQSAARAIRGHQGLFLKKMLSRGYGQAGG